MKKQICIIVLILISCFSQAQNFNSQYHKFDNALRPEVRSQLYIPDILGYKTMKCDFHIHTIFSDGEVLPSLRSAEAWCEGLDAIAITDHNKYKADFLNADYNKSYELAKKRADELGLIVIKGVEYTDRKPVGHLNFLFIDDANRYERTLIEPEAAVELAASEGAFIIYNHPGWPDQNSDLFDFQKKFIKQKNIHAIEIFNQAEFYPVAIDYCNDFYLAPLGCSDIHSPINFDYDLSVSKRPMTLVFAKEATEAGIKEALFAGRTVAYGNEILAGKEEFIKEIFKNSMGITNVSTKKDQSLFNITNKSSICYSLESDGKVLMLPAGKTVQVKVKNVDFNKSYILKNAFCGAQKNVMVTLALQ
ncbi:MAG: PHP domain-containing protein [Prolixibacteraceae bacterium]|nr:PHP domain-containing protein [Prolixibacteraceae bacterium]